MEGYDEIYHAVDEALNVGYRSFDCSPILRQEEDLGNALKFLLPKYNLERKDIYLTCKLFPKDYGAYQMRDAFWSSCRKLGYGYLDLYLMEWPGGRNMDCEDRGNEISRTETWKEMNRLLSEGLCRNIGVCNFTVKQLEDLIKKSKVIPAVNQVEFHPKFRQVDLLEYCKNNNILMQAISFENTLHPLVYNDKIVKRIATNLKKTPVQVVLKWILNKGVAVICQSRNPSKIRQNFKLFDFVLEKAEMDAINAIEGREKYLKNPICIL